MDKYKTKVIYRACLDNSILAVFPEEYYNIHLDECLRVCYSRIGQHSSCDLGYIFEHTRQATRTEYKPLREELTGIGYNLQLIDTKPIEEPLLEY